MTTVNQPANFLRYSPILGTTTTYNTINNVAVASNLITFTTATAHGISQIGTIFTVQGVSAALDGVYAAYTFPLSTTVTAVSIGTTTLSSVAVSPVGLISFNTSMVSGWTVTNKVVQNYVATLTTGSAHGFAVGDNVFVNIGDAIYDSAQVKIVGVPSTTTFMYIVSTQTASTTSVSQGAVGKYPIYTTSNIFNIATDIVIANQTASAQTYSISLDGKSIAYQQPISANQTIDFGFKQLLATSKVISASASSPLVFLHISGMTAN